MILPGYFRNQSNRLIVIRKMVQKLMTFVDKASNLIDDVVIVFYMKSLFL